MQRVDIGRVYPRCRRAQLAFGGPCLDAHRLALREERSRRQCRQPAPRRCPVPLPPRVRAGASPAPGPVDPVGVDVDVDVEGVEPERAARSSVPPPASIARLSGRRIGFANVASKMVPSGSARAVRDRDRDRPARGRRAAGRQRPVAVVVPSGIREREEDGRRGEDRAGGQARGPHRRPPHRPARSRRTSELDLHERLQAVLRRSPCPRGCSSRRSGR